jgi:hypothetical protein
MSLAVFLFKLFDQAGFLKRLVGAVFIQRAQALGRDGNRNCLVKLGDKNALFLQIDLLAGHARGVKFGCANTIAVFASHFRTLFSYCADFCHTLYKKIRGRPPENVMVS